ncbi:TetR/AcrR family transcriptional regulator [Mariniluteicoccus flavus]
MPAAERRQKLIEAAKRVIARDGVASATTRAVAAEAEMPLASFHYVFESQQELMRELIRAVAEEESGALASVEVPEGQEFSVKAMLDAFLDHVLANRGSQLAAFEINHYALRTPGLEDLANVRTESARRTVRQAIAFCEQQLGPLRGDPEVVTHMMMVIADGLVTVLLSDGDEAAARRTIGLIAPTIQRAFFGGDGARETRS